MAGLRAGVLLGGGLMLWMVTNGPLVPYREALFDHTAPQLVLVLGGDVDRERMGAKLARQLQLPLLISGGSNREYASWLVQNEGLSAERVQLDYRARDTLGNFTSLVDDLRARQIRHILLVTSSDHLPRSMAIGQVVAGSRGIHLTGVPVACEPSCRREGSIKYWGDWLRAVAWVITGHDLRDATLPDPAER